jgi:hypothetical protein
MESIQKEIGHIRSILYQEYLAGKIDKKVYTEINNIFNEIVKKLNY